jgi:hypothetical protein
MIDFFHEGNNIGFSLSGVFGFILLAYILIEFSFFIITKTFLIHKFFIGLRVRSQIKKMLPDWWYIEKISYLTINRSTKFSIVDPLLTTWSFQYPEYQVYVKVRSKIPTGGHHIYGDNTCTTNDWVKVNWLGKIKRQSLMDSIFVEDNTHQSEIKQWSREKALEKIGI